MFQPHLYSRTRRLLEDFAQSFVNADVAVVTEIYGAREESDGSISGRDLVERSSAEGHPDTHFVEGLRDVSGYLRGIVREGDCIVFLGAGDIWRVCHDVAATAKSWFRN